MKWICYANVRDVLIRIRPFPYWLNGIDVTTMKRVLIRMVFVFSIILTAGCSAASPELTLDPTRRPSVAPTGNPVPTATYTPTITPTSTITPTITSTPTRTPTPTRTATPTKTSIPTPELPVLSSWKGPVNLISKLQYAWEAGVWNDKHHAGGNLTVVDDQDFGPQSMFLSTVTDNSVKPIRIYMDKAGPALQPSENGLCSISIVVEASADYLHPPSDGFINFLGFFSEALDYFQGVGSILIDYTSNGSTIPSIYTSAKGKDFPPYDQAMFHKPLKPNTKYEMSLKFSREGQLIGEIRVYNPVTKQFEPYDATSASIDPQVEHQITSLHGGAYARGVPNGATIKHSGIDIICR